MNATILATAGVVAEVDDWTLSEFLDEVLEDLFGADVDSDAAPLKFADLTEAQQEDVYAYMEDKLFDAMFDNTSDWEIDDVDAYSIVIEELNLL